MVLPLVLALVLAAFLHELGHLFTAKICGVGVVRIVIGFGPLVRCWTWGSTLVELRAVPAGGAIAVVTAYTVEDIESGDADPLLIEMCRSHPKLLAKLKEPRRSIDNRTALVQIAVYLGGVVANGIAGVAALALFIATSGVPAHADGLRVESVERGGPAAQAGIHAGDKIVRVNDVPVERWEDVARLACVGQRGSLRVEFERNGETQGVTLSPAKRGLAGKLVGPPAQRGRLPEIGVIGSEPAKRKPSFAEGTNEAIRWIEHWLGFAVSAVLILPPLQPLEFQGTDSLQLFLCFLALASFYGLVSNLVPLNRRDATLVVAVIVASIWPGKAGRTERKASVLEWINRYSMFYFALLCLSIVARFYFA